MIDLREPNLPSGIVANGREYALVTDFRAWIEFDRVLREDGEIYMGVFAGQRPFGSNWHEALLDFFKSPNSTPRTSASAGPREIDLVEDGELIVAAFQQAYGIDLTATDMHWHRFKALLAGLPDDTRLVQVMGIRGYKRQSGKHDHDAEMRKRQQAWRLPDPGENEARADVLKWAETYFGD